MLNCATATSTLVLHMKVLLLRPILKFHTQVISFHFRGVFKGYHSKTRTKVEPVTKGQTRVVEKDSLQILSSYGDSFFHCTIEMNDV